MARNFKLLGESLKFSNFETKFCNEISFSIFDPKVCIGLKFTVFETEAAETSKINSGQNFKLSIRNWQREILIKITNELKYCYFRVDS